MKRFFIDITLAQQLGLQGAELLCFFALQALCATTTQPSVRVSYSELARLSGCGNRDTARRSISNLLQRELIFMDSNDAYSIAQNARFIESTTAQNEHPTAQIEQPTAQNARFCEKEINKENKLVSINNRTNQPTQVFKKEEFIIPSQPQVMEYAQQHNISATVAQKWYLYWEQHSWTQPNGQPMGKWQPCLEGFALREKSLSPSPSPSDTFRSDPVAYRFRSTTGAFRGDSSPSQRERNEEIYRQIKAEERAKRDADWAERENNRAAAAAFFARHPDWLNHS